MRAQSRLHLLRLERTSQAEWTVNSRYWRKHFHPLAIIIRTTFWTWQKVDDEVRSGDLDRAYDITPPLLRAAKTNDELSYIAAGPLEDLVDGYGEPALDRLEKASDEDARLQFALSGIRLLPESPILQRSAADGQARLLGWSLLCRLLVVRRRPNVQQK